MGRGHDVRLVVGVMGHVDHGKTSLVRALTGMETDRLAEEARRGISIALGFAHLPVPGGTVDLIDMPGHERFVRTMVSGATGVDAVLLVVAATEGVMPQTVEHLDIAALLGLDPVVVAVSKADLVDLDQTMAVGEQVATIVRAAGLRVDAIVPTSTATGQGVAALQATLAGLDAAPRADDGFAYLPIDRVFPVQGHGTVVTGTLRRGRLAVHDEVAMAPGGRAVRLRGMQVHGARTESAQPGQRVAVNLRDLEVGEIGRGVALTAHDTLPASAWLTVGLRMPAGAPGLRNGARTMMLFGTEEVEARLRLLDRDEMLPGQSALAQLQCGTPVAVPARERFILRRISPQQTVAGGSVIDPAAVRLRRNAPDVLARWGRLAGADAPGIVAAELEEAGAGGVALGRLAQLAGVSQARAAQLLQPLPVVIGRSRVVVARAAFGAVCDGVRAALARHGDLPPERVAALLPQFGRAVLDDAVAELARTGVVLRVGGLLRLPMARRDAERVSAEAAAIRRLATALREAGLTPPDIRVVAPDPQTRRLVDRLIREGVFVRTFDKVQRRELVFHQDAIDAAKHRLAPLLVDRGLLVGEAGTALGISRKYCVPLLEHLDAIRFTRRVTDRRVLANP